jgi:hypothetical protein
MKQGDLAIVTTLRRTTRGLEVCVQCHDAVEDFLRTNGAEEITPVGLKGRQWRRLGSDIPLEAYELPPDMQGVRLVSQKIGYRLDHLGMALTGVDNNTGLKTINMSFLRLVGTSLPGGVSFQVTGVHSEEDVQWIANAIRDASRAIYMQYMKSMEISIELEEQLPMRQETLRGTPIIDVTGMPF